MNTRGHGRWSVSLPEHQSLESGLLRARRPRGHRRPTGGCIAVSGRQSGAPERGARLALAGEEQSQLGHPRATSSAAAAAPSIQPARRPAVRNATELFIRTINRVGGGLTPAALPHHRTYGSRIRRFLPPVTGLSLRPGDDSPIKSIDAATAIGTSGPWCYVTSSLAGQLSRLDGEIAAFPLMAGSALRGAVRATTMASADSHPSIPTPHDVSSTRQNDGPPRVMRVTFMLMPVGFTS